MCETPSGRKCNSRLPSDAPGRMLGSCRRAVGCPTLACRVVPPSAQICLRRRLLLTRDPGFRPRPSGECDTRIRRSGVRALLSGEKSRTQRLTRDSRKNRALRRWRDLSTLSSRRRSGSRQKAARHARRGLDSSLRRSDEGGYPIFPGQQWVYAGVQEYVRMAHRISADRGRGAVSLLPALRTVRAVLPHTALRSVVIYIEIGAQERELAIG